MTGPTEVPVDVRPAEPGDADLAAAAAALIDEASAAFDIARREVDWIAAKMSTGRAAIALMGGVLVGFGCWSDWEQGAFVSHSALVVRPDLRGLKLARRLKGVLFESSRRRFPRAVLMSLTTSEPVRAMNLSLGFRPVPLARLTKDPAFWAGCLTCRNYEEICARGQRCCCEGMILDPPETDERP